MIAAHFAGAGVRVAVIDAGLAGHDSTSASTALLMPEPDRGLVELSARYGDSAAVRTGD